MTAPAANQYKKFGQTIQTIGATLTVANTNLDGTGTITDLLTAGASGSLVRHLSALARATVTATSIRLFIHDGTNWFFYDDYLMAAHTVAATTAQSKVTLVDRTDPTKAIRLETGWKLGAAIAVALAGGISIVGDAEDL